MKLSEIRFIDHYGDCACITVDEQKTLIKIALQMCIENRREIGSYTLEEMQQLYNKIRWEKYLDRIGKDFNDLTDADIETIGLMEAEDQGYPL